jgi:hypothetical protein
MRLQIRHDGSRVGRVIRMAPSCVSNHRSATINFLNSDPEIPMRAQLLILIAAIGLVGSVTAAADSTQSATWTQRKLLGFSPPPNYAPGVGYASNAHFISCDEIIDRVQFILVQLGARPDDITVDQRDCRRGQATVRSVDVKFSVLAPADSPANPAAGAPVEAHWQTIELGGSDVGLGDCAFLKYVTLKILPLFSTRNVKLIPPDVCAKVGVGLRAEVLKAPSERAASR